MYGFSRGRIKDPVIARHRNFKEFSVDLCSADSVSRAFKKVKKAVMGIQLRRKRINNLLGCIEETEGMIKCLENELEDLLEKKEDPEFVMAKLAKYRQERELIESELAMLKAK